MSGTKIKNFEEVEKYIYSSNDTHWLARYNKRNKIIEYKYCYADGSPKEGAKWSKWESHFNEDFLRAIDSLIKSKNPNYVAREQLSPVIEKLRELEDKFKQYQTNKLMSV